LHMILNHDLKSFDYKSYPTLVHVIALKNYRYYYYYY